MMKNFRPPVEVSYLAYGLFVVLIVRVAMTPWFDPDVWWHLASGREILTNGLPSSDPGWSWSLPAGSFWFGHEWLADVVMYGLYQLGGLPLLGWSFAMLGVVTWGFVYATARAHNPLWFGSHTAVVITLMVALAMLPFMGARPQVFTMFFTALFIWAGESYDHRIIKPLLPLAMLLWVNLHGGWMLGIIILIVYWLVYVDKHVMAFALWGSLALTLVNPRGLRVWLYPLETLGSGAMRGLIAEWASPNWHDPTYWPALALLLALVVVALWSRAPGFSYMVLFAVMGIAAALQSTRHIPLFALLSVPALAYYLNDLIAPLGYDRAHLFPQTNTTAGRAYAGLVLAGLLAFVPASGAAVAAANSYPDTAVVQSLPPETMAHYNWGGWLIWNGQQVFIDGRADLYGDAFMLGYHQTIMARGDWERWLNEHDVKTVYLPNDVPLSAVLSVHSDWHKQDLGDAAVYRQRWVP